MTSFDSEIAVLEKFPNRAAVALPALDDAQPGMCKAAPGFSASAGASAQIIGRFSRLAASVPGLWRKSSMARGPLLSAIRGRIGETSVMARLGGCWRRRCLLFSLTNG